MFRCFRTTYLKQKRGTLKWSPARDGLDSTAWPSPTTEGAERLGCVSRVWWCERSISHWLSKRDIMWACVSLTGHLGTGVGFVKLVALPNIQIPSGLCGLARAIICHLLSFHLFEIIWPCIRPQLCPSSNPFLFRLGFCLMKRNLP